MNISITTAELDITTRKKKVFSVSMTNRDSLGEEHYKMMLKDYEEIRARRKAFHGKPDQYDRLIMSLDKLFESFYKSFLD